MFNTCYACGQYRSDKTIDPSGPFAVCPECGYAHPFRQLPLLMVGGASGTGKSAVLHSLISNHNSVVMLEADILWQPEFNLPDDNYRSFFETWLRMAKNIGQSGRSVVLFGAGLSVPDNIEPCVERRYFSSVHYLALVCDDEVLETRLKDRPSWRESGDETFIESQKQFNQWFKDYDNKPPITLLDTTDSRVVETAVAMADWIDAVLRAGPDQTRPRQLRPGL